MVYGRDVDGATLSFEASGALRDASLVMRDRETDSWWSIMSADAIGGRLEGTSLVELPVGEKTTFGAWRAAHPDTLVLSVEGAEHAEDNPYDRYLDGERTFRDLEVDDPRLPAKASVYAFHLDGQPFAVPHEAFVGGAVLEHPSFGGRALWLSRAEGPIYPSSEALWLPAERPRRLPAVRKLVRGGQLEAVGGFDTFWYTWVAVNTQTALIRN